MNTKHITEVTLHNYRGYKHTVIPITAGLNVIYGEGDAGKSALEKALGWCLFDEKQGKFINSGITTPKGSIKSKEEVYVQTNFDTGDIIRRGANSSTVNLYWIGSVGKPFEEWGDPIQNFKAVPPEVQKIINLSSVNIGKQFDPHFLLSSKGSEIAKDLNKMVNLEIIDSSQSNAKHFVTKIKREKEASEFNLAKYEKDLEEYHYLDAMGKGLEKLEQIEQSILENKDSQKEIGLLLNSLEEGTEKLEKFKKVLTFKSFVEDSQELQEKISLTSNEVRVVGASLSQIQENREMITKFQRAIPFKNIISEIIDFKEKKDVTEKDIIEIDNLLEKADILSKINKQKATLVYKPVVESIALLEEKIKKEDEKYSHITELLDLVEGNTSIINNKKLEVQEMKKNLVGVCPTCNRAFGECEEVVQK